MGNGISLWARSREAGPRGATHGGVAIAARAAVTSFAPLSVPNPENYEVLAVSGYIHGIDRKMFVVAAYLPPNYTVRRAKSALTYIYELIMDIKNRYVDPYIIVAGDFNQWDLQEALLDFPDLWEAIGGPTRGERRIDRVFSNLPEDESQTNVLPPLRAESSESDHKIVRLLSRVPQRERRNGQLTTTEKPLKTRRQTL